MMDIPRLVIAAPQGKSGKTTITLGLCAALSARGLKLQPFKKGPDYIDPSWLSEASGRACRSLDPFFCITPENLLESFLLGARGADLVVVEGNHGMYDSLDEDGSGSTAAVARTLRAPVLLVVNTARMSRSAAAMVYGFKTFEPETNIAGVILNNVAQGRHEAKLRQAIESACGIPVVGAVPRDDNLLIPDRHLGLIPEAEQEGALSVISACRQAAEQHMDLEAILSIARQAPKLQSSRMADITHEPVPVLARIGVIRDRAFSFYYPENLEALEAAGAELLFLDALHDASLPALDALIIGGGFPEIFMQELAANLPFREAVRMAVIEGLPVYAECGGLMYLSQRIAWGDRSAEMAGVLPVTIEMTGRPQGHGYVMAKVDRENPFLPVGSQLRGHEFHHSRLAGRAHNLSTAYHLERGAGSGEKRDGLVFANVLAAYTHLHTAGSPAWAVSIVRRAAGLSS